MTVHKLASLVAQMVRICLQRRRPRLDPWITNKDLLYSRGISSQYPIITYKGNESERK